MKKRHALIGLFLFVLIITVVYFTIFVRPPDFGRTDMSEPLEKKELTGRQVTILTNRPHLRAAEFLAEQFRKETGIVVRNIAVDYKEGLQYALADIASADPKIDVIMFWYCDLGALVERNGLMDLTDFIENRKRTLCPDDFIQSIYDPYTLYNGRRWALPYDGDTHVLFYHKPILEKYDLEPPETWNDYLEIAKTITENERQNGMYGTAIMAPDNPMVIVSSYMNRLGSYGGKLLDDVRNPLGHIDTAVQALEDMIEQSRYAIPTPLETSWEVSRDGFLSEKAAMVEQWTDIGIMAEDAGQSLIKGKWGVVRMPRADTPEGRHSAALNSGFSLGISSKTSNVEAAEAYLLFATEPEMTLRLNMINGGMDPTRISVLTSSKYKQFAPELCEAVRASIDHATPWPRLPQTPEMLNVLTRNLRFALGRRKPPREALEETRNEWIRMVQ